jgi:hypothetical protein
MSEIDDLLDPGVTNQANSNGGQDGKLPSANATLTLGIISIVGCFLYALPGLICGISALVLHKKDREMYKSDPVRYEQSYKNAKAGYVCAIIGTSLSAAYILFLIFAFAFAFSVISTGMRI